MSYQDKLKLLRDFSDLQGEMAAKARKYADNPALALRFDRASYAASNARMFMHAALMAERETVAREGMQ